MVTLTDLVETIRKHSRNIKQEAKDDEDALDNNLYRNGLYQALLDDGINVIKEAQFHHGKNIICPDLWVEGIASIEIKDSATEEDPGSNHERILKEATGTPTILVNFLVQGDPHVRIL